MAIDAKKISVRVGRFVIATIRAWRRSLSDHPFVWFVVFFALFLYKYFPSLLAFLVSSAPVLVCTAVLLGTLLSLGQPNIPQIEEEEKTTQGVSALKSTGLADNHVIESDARISVQRKEFEKGIEEEKGSPRENRRIEEREHEEERLIEVGFQLGELHTEEPCITEQRTEPDAHLEGQIEFSHASSWKEIDGHDDLDSSSDGAESSSPDASMTDIMPMLDELHPLLDVDAPQPAASSPKDSDEDSEESTDGDESHNDSEALDEEEKIQEDEEEEEVQDDQEDGASGVVTWTEDDEKNLKDIKTLELERNLKMENLIAKRIATKNQKAMTERNLIDLDGFSVQIPSVSTTRRNPFDLPYSSTENPDLPPIPGSAPSVLLPRINPFDHPYDQSNNSNSITEESSSQQDSVTLQQRELLFRRHESFTLGTSFSGEIKHETGRLKPYFVVETAVPEQTSISSLQRQMSEKSDSKVSSVNETDTNSSIPDQEQKETLDDESQLEVGTSSPNVKNVELDSRSDSSEEPLDVEQEQAEMDVDAVEIISNEVEDGVDVSQSEIVDESYGGQLSSSSSEDSDKCVLEKGKDEPIKWSTVSVQSSLTEAERAEETLAVGPVYDTSPSAIEKSISNMTAIEEALFYPDKDDFNSSSMESDTGVVMSERPLPLAPEKSAESIVEDGKVEIEAGSSNKGFWAASLNLVMVNEHELESREVAGLSEVQQDDDNSAEPVILESASSVADLLLQDVEGEGAISQADLNAELYEPDTKIWATKMEILESVFTDNSISSIGSAEGTEVLSKKNDEAEGIKEFDEHLLAELDAVGDFNVQRDSIATEADVKMYSSEYSCKEDVLSNMEAVKVNFVDRKEYLTESIKQEKCDTDFEHQEEINLNFQQIQVEKALSMEWVNEKSKLDATGDFIVVEANQATRADDGVNSTAVTSSEEGVLDVGSGGFYLIDEEVSAEWKEYNKELEVLEARSLEDIDSAFLHIAGDKSPLLFADPELQVVDAASTKEISSAIWQPIEEDADTSFALELSNQISEVEESGVESAILDPIECEVGSASSPYLKYSSNELEILDARSVQEIDSAFMKIKGESEKSVIQEAVDGNSAVVVTIPELEVTDATLVEDFSASFKHMNNNIRVSGEGEISNNESAILKIDSSTEKLNDDKLQKEVTVIDLGTLIIEHVSQIDNSNAENLHERIKEMPDDSCSKESTKKKRSSTSESSSSSSSSSSDSD